MLLKKFRLNNLKFFLVAIIPLCFFTVNAQEKFTGLTEPAFALKIPADSTWSFEAGVANRNVVYQNGGFDFQGKFLELNGFANYSLDARKTLSLGFRYRFKGLFEQNRVDEKRLIEQFSRRKNAFKERLRAEERFREKNTLRLRYRFGFVFPLASAEKNTNPLFMALQTETLFSVGNHIKRSVDQRASMIFEKGITKKAKAKVGLQYRLENYTENTVHELFLVMEVAVSL